MFRTYNACCNLTNCNTPPPPEFDAYCFISPDIANFSNHAAFTQPLKELIALDPSAGKSSIAVACAGSAMVLFKSTGPLTRDFDDVRQYYETAAQVMARALKAGKSKILVCSAKPDSATPEDAQYAKYKQVTAQGALEATYLPLENRERMPEPGTPVTIYFDEFTNELAKKVDAIEQAAVVARDIGGGDPERMAPPRMLEYCEQHFKPYDHINMTVISDQDEIAEKFPCFQAVNRATKNVPRHHGRIIFFEYSEGTHDEHLCLVGKGVSYDTGGADIKAGGVMASMSRDKCGAANIIGFMAAVAELKPKNVRITAAVSCIRNSVGSECYVSDEIIKTRAGRYIRIGNTDAEGRMAMVDVLCLMKERCIAENWKNPSLFTWATLTGHSCLAFGEHYSAIMDNGPARRRKTAQRLFDAGHLVADPYEISTIRREDYEAMSGKDVNTEIHQSNSAPSTRTPRGHQNPSAFLIMASGLDSHGIDSEKPICYTHIDMAPSAGPYPGLPSGNPMRSFVESYCK